MNIHWFWLAIITIFGACVGSFLNVVIYRLPRGLTLLNPRFSFCPSCKRTLEWWENVPVLAWFYLGGRCSTCRSRISPIYPVIEGFTAIAFAVVYWGLYLNPLRAADFGHAGLVGTWPVLVVYLVLVAGMIGATVIDAKYYIIPLQIPWLISAVALVLLPVGVRLVGRRLLPYDLAVSPQATGIWFGAAIGGGIGLAIALVLLYTGVLPQSFADDEAVHDAVSQHPHVHPQAAEDGAAASSQPAADITTNTAPPTEPQVGSSEPVAAATAPVEMLPPAPAFGVAFATVPAASTPEVVNPTIPSDPSAAAAPPPAGVTVTLPSTPTLAPTSAPTSELIAPPAPPDPISAGVSAADVTLNEPGNPPPLSSIPGAEAVGTVDGDAIDQGRDPHVPRAADEIDAWLAHPHLNREIGKECLFVGLPLLGFIVGAWVFHQATNPVRPPLISPWAQVLVGVLCGYLVGGGVVWIVRILGSLGFQKEAMGLGDVHLLAAIGAVMGSMDSIVIFFLAAFLGLGYAAVVFCLNRVLKERQLRIIPYGPYLALAAVLMMIFEPQVMEVVVGWMRQH